MNRPDDDLHDAWLDASLEERLGGAAPPDLSALILGTAPVPQRRRLPAAIAAVALVALGLAVILGVRALRGEGGVGGAEAPAAREAGPVPDQDAPQDPVLDLDRTRPARVLFVEALPRWEYRYLKNALIRAPDVAAQAFLTGASASFVQEHSRGLPALTALPRTAAELAAYDVILVGDLTPADIGGDAAERADWVAALTAFARDGGGVGFLCGENGMPESWRGTGLIDLLPVELSAPPMPIAAPRERVGFAPGFTSDGIDHPVLRLDENPLKTAQVLCDVRFPSVIAFGAAREDATVLLLADGTLPLLAVHQVGTGRTLLVATADTWRLREIDDGRYHARLWAQILDWLARRER